MIVLTPHLPSRGAVTSKSAQRVAYAAAQGANHAGAMVAIRIPAFAAEQLAVPGGEPAADLHVTLAYLGDVADLTEEQCEALTERLDELCGSIDPFDARVTGYGRFRNGEGEDEVDVLWAGFDSPALAMVRHRVVEACQSVGVYPRNDHGFTPHVTLAYVEPGAGEDSFPPDTTMTVKYLTLALGGQELALRLRGADPTGELPAETYSLLQSPSEGPFDEMADLELWAQRKGALIVRADLDLPQAVIVKRGDEVIVSVEGIPAGEALLDDLIVAAQRPSVDYVAIGWVGAREPNGETESGGSYVAREQLLAALSGELLATPIFFAKDLIALDGDLTTTGAADRLELLRGLMAQVGSHALVPHAAFCGAESELDAAVDEAIAWRPAEGGIAPIGVSCVRANSSYAHGTSDEEAVLVIRPVEAHKVGWTDEAREAARLARQRNQLSGQDAAMQKYPEATAHLLEAGMRVDGLQQTMRHGDYITFTDLQTGTTMLVAPAQVTPEFLAAKIEAKRREFGVEKDGMTTAGMAGTIAPQQGKFRRQPVERSICVPMQLVVKYITHSGDVWLVHAESGRVLGRHGSRAEAAAQLAAIEANKHAKSEDGDTFPTAFGAHTFVVGTLRNGAFVDDPEHPRVNPYEALFLRSAWLGVAKEWSDEARAAALEARRRHKKPDANEPPPSGKPTPGKFQTKIDKETGERAIYVNGIMIARTNVGRTTLHVNSGGGSYTTYYAHYDAEGMKKLLGDDIAVGRRMRDDDVRERLVSDMGSNSGMLYRNVRRAIERVSQKLGRPIEFPSEFKSAFDVDYDEESDYSELSAEPGLHRGGDNGTIYLTAEDMIEKVGWTDEARAAALLARLARVQVTELDPVDEGYAAWDDDVESIYHVTSGSITARQVQWRPGESELYVGEIMSDDESKPNHADALRLFMGLRSLAERHGAKIITAHAANPGVESLMVRLGGDVKRGPRDSFPEVTLHLDRLRKDAFDGASGVEVSVEKVGWTDEARAAAAESRRRSAAWQVDDADERRRLAREHNAAMGDKPGFRVEEADGEWETWHHPGGDVPVSAHFVVEDRSGDKQLVLNYGETELRAEKYGSDVLVSYLGDPLPEHVRSDDTTRAGEAETQIGERRADPRPNEVRRVLRDLVNRARGSRAKAIWAVAANTSVSEMLERAGAEPMSDVGEIADRTSTDLYGSLFHSIGGDFPIYRLALDRVRKDWYELQPDTSGMAKKTMMWNVEEPLRADPTERQALGVDRGRVQLGKCYVEAGRYVIGRGDATLVHGEVQIGQAKSADGSGLPIDHAWVEMGNVVYDGTQGQFYDRDDYYAKMRAVATKRYPAAEATRRMLATQHFGPWRD